MSETWPLRPECPMCGPSCVGGAHYNALMEDGIDTKEKFLAMAESGKTCPNGYRGHFNCRCTRIND